MQPNTFQDKTHAAAYRAWIMERIYNGELRETLHRRHQTIQPDPNTLKLLRKLQNIQGGITQ